MPFKDCSTGAGTNGGKQISSTYRTLALHLLLLLLVTHFNLAQDHLSAVMYQRQNAFIFK